MTVDEAGCRKVEMANFFMELLKIKKDSAEKFNSCYADSLKAELVKYRNELEIKCNEQMEVIIASLAAATFLKDELTRIDNLLIGEHEE